MTFLTGSALKYGTGSTQYRKMTGSAIKVSRMEQRQKNLGSRVALLPRKFLRIPKIFAHKTEKPFKVFQYFQNDPDFSRLFLTFRMVSKLSGFFQTLVAGAWTERKKMFLGGSFLKLADEDV